ncbi:acetylxylan esterase precursor [Colletotrichum tofieldiae]|uniref:Acetylxylan esterase (Cutinase) n=1 Tax=Colletotrichum tofieldiae TaxID=708197 RepID=A0A166U0F5_9PEZI|nr:acetylxylan esterase precursor (cutinase) [Colletotrichum tofieldiae]GKT64097.1 acetylxylan esterase precursor [Colletotrichum tofieldiae]GKT71935.1 acetylxylan esterase precursor [Colletotrichum tofieldiae]
MLSPKAAALFNFFLLATAAPGKRQSTGSGSCTDLHIFLARGWNEGYPGRQQLIIDATCNGLSSCDYEDIQFDASNPEGYPRAVEQGRASGVSQIKAYTEKCPNSKVALSGYSEGANVVANILADSGLAANAAPGNMVCAALLFGDPTHIADQSYNVEAGSGYSGQMARSSSSLANLNNFAGVLRSWCNGEDTVCAYGEGRTMGEDAHTNYFQLYTNDAAAYIKEKCVSSSPAPTTTATSTAPAPTSTGSFCVSGKVKPGLSDNYTGLCDFACSNGYCPDGVCECSAFGQQTTSPGGDGRDGCPADGLDDSYKGLCSFSCSHGYCPTGACKYC